ncbi:MAG: methionyl-tRNA formyltransferase [Tenuifilaceae bacterium]
MDKEIKIVFFGEDSFSNIVLNSLINSNYLIQFVLTPFYNNNIHKRLEHTCKINKIHFFRESNVNAPSIIKLLKDSAPDFIIIAHFEKLISKEIIDIPKFGCLNLHPSLLPYYRGMSPQHWPIINGDKKTGITVHFIDEGVDTGNIIIQEEIPLNNRMYVSDLQIFWTRIYPEIVCKAIKLVLNGFKGIIQRDDKGSYYPKLKQKDCRIDIYGSVFQAYNLLRGVSFPYHGAFVELNNEIIKIWRAEIMEVRVQGQLGQVIHKGNDVYLTFYDGTLKISKSEIIKIN